MGACGENERWHWTCKCDNSPNASVETFHQGKGLTGKACAHSTEILQSVQASETMQENERPKWKNEETCKQMAIKKSRPTGPVMKNIETEVGWWIQAKYLVFMLRSCLSKAILKDRPSESDLSKMELKDKGTLFQVIRYKNKYYVTRHPSAFGPHTARALGGTATQSQEK